MMKINRCTNLETGEVIEAAWSRRKLRRKMMGEFNALPRNLKFKTLWVPDNYFEVGVN